MFSIIVPSYNRNQEINALLESLKQQTAYNFEVIIVDDCSKIPVSETLGILNEFNDISTKEKVRELLTRDSLSHIYSYPFDVKVVRNNPNVGAAQSRNVGATNATQEWLLFLDDDDRFMPEKCERLAAEIANNPTANFVYHPANVKW